jgi:hypothetical protein
MKLPLDAALDGKGYLVRYTSGSDTVEAEMQDASGPGLVMEDDPDHLGIFKVTVTLTKTGDYTLLILLKGLEVPTQLASAVTVTPKEETSH